MFYRFFVRYLGMQLVRPGPEYLASYVAALERGWSADNERGIEAGHEELSRIKNRCSDISRQHG